MQIIEVRLASHSYTIHVGHGLLQQAGELLRRQGLGGMAVIITDSKVGALYGRNLLEGLSVGGIKASVIEIAPGEEQKTLESAGRLYNRLTDLHAERATPILALGGGVIGDLAGFVAATYMRGVPLVQVPTTLLAQGDSSIGGKVAVNHGNLKNRVGTFYHPSLTISDVATLKTLSRRELSDGMAEIIKHGMVLDYHFFAFLEKNIQKVLSLDPAILEDVISQSVRIKADTVEQDEFDLGVRNILNYGHTIGHAIESVSGLTVWHGEAVAMGMIIEARIANKLNMLSKDNISRLKMLISRAGLPIKPPHLDIERLIGAMQHDKKVTEGKLRFALPKATGAATIVDDVSLSIIRQVLSDDEET
jgi:3-dehydroquinate synthase